MHPYGAAFAAGRLLKNKNQTLRVCRAFARAALPAAVIVYHILFKTGMQDPNCKKAALSY